MYCQHCGSSIAKGSAFCGVCGRAVEVLATSDVSTTLGAPTPTPRPAGGHRADRPKPLALVVGRGPSCAVRLDAPSVSQQHARVIADGDALVILDLDSRNGTFVDGEQVRRARIRPGNIVRLGLELLPWDHPALGELARGLPPGPVPAPALEPAGDEPASAPRQEATPADLPKDRARRASAGANASTTGSAPALADDSPSSPPSSRRRAHRGFEIIAVGVVSLAVVAVLALVGAMLVRFVRADTPPPAAARSADGSAADAARPRASEAPSWSPCDEGSADAPCFGAETPVAASAYAERLADQVDLRTHLRRVEATRLALRTAAVWPGRPANLQVRDAWVVPLGRPVIDGARVTVLGTTRCSLDLRHPAAEGLDEVANLALMAFTSEGPRIYRLSRPPALPGATRVIDLRQRPRLGDNAFWRDEVTRHRFFEEILSGRVPGATASLPSGSWNGSSGADIAFVSVSEQDPEVHSLRPRGTLGMSHPSAAVALIVEPGRRRWPRATDFSAAAASCLSDTPLGPEPGDVDRERFELLATAAALDRLSQVLPGALSGELAAEVAEALVGRSRRTGPVWTTTFVSDPARAVLDVEWANDGGLLLRYATAEGTAEARLAGVTRGAIPDALASRIVATVRALARREDARLVLLSREGRSPVATLVVPATGLDASAELLRRGLVPLDLARREQLAQQPGLVLQALLARRDPHTSTAPALTDDRYVGALDALFSR